MLYYSLLVLLFISPALTYLCSCVNRPELVLLTGNTRSGQTFCLGERAQLKCIYPEGEQALWWYVNSSKRPINVVFLAEDLPSHNTTTPFGNFTILSIVKEESFRGNYSCAVIIPYPKRDVRSNSVEVLFEDTEPDGVKATCLSSGRNSITVAVNYTNGCRRETVVEANGVECKILSTAPTMTICYCTSLQPNTSYNITADSNGHTDSITCNTTMEQQMSDGSSAEHSDSSSDLAFLAILALVPVAGFGIALGLLLYRHRKSQHGYYSTEHSLQLQLESNTDGACNRSGSDESKENANSADPLAAETQVDDRDQDVKYAHLDHSGPRPIPAPSPHERVKYAAIVPEQEDV